MAAPIPNRAEAITFAVFRASLLLVSPCTLAKKTELRGSFEKKREQPARMINTPKMRRKINAYFIFYPHLNTLAFSAWLLLCCYGADLLLFMF